MKPLLTIALVILCALTALAARKERALDRWRPTQYTVAITLDEQLKTITTARTEVTLVTLSRNVATIDLDFGQLKVDSVTVNRRPARFTHANGLLEVTLSRPPKPNTPLTIAVVYHGTPKDGLVLTNDKDGHPSAVGDNWPDRVHHWIPSLDHPAAKAPITFNITAPAATVVVANGNLSGVKNSSLTTRTWTYTETVPIPPYCMIFAAGRFAKVVPAESALVPLSYYVPQSDAGLAVQGFSAAAPSLKFFTETVAPYPYEKLALIVGATQFGGMENSSAIVFRSNLLTPKTSTQLSATFQVPRGTVSLVAHEIAHQWFGDSVTESTWSDLWLSEGFATYFAALFIQKTEGEPAFREYMKDAASVYLAYQKQKRTPLHDRDTENLFDLLNGNNYQKGAWVLHMLRVTLGDRDFFQGIRDYYLKHKNATASTEDLRLALERSSGKDLRTFFNGWVYGTGHPHYQLSSGWDRNRGVVILTLEQTQPEAAFFNELPVEVTTAEGKQRVLFNPTSKTTIKELQLAGPPSAIEVDPDDSVLKEVVVKLK